jgi:hypothetical protein
LRFIGRKLEQNGISISELHCSQDTKELIEKDNYLKRQQMSIKNHAPQEEYYLKFPTILFGVGKSSFHVWCATSEEKYEKGYATHFHPDVSIILTANLQKLD